MSLEEIALHLPRNAFTPRDTARAGDLWRVCQEAAVLGSSRRGWPPERYREAGCAFVVRGMTAVHHRPAAYGQPIVARTWVTTFRRGTLTDRQVRVRGPDGLICAATQRWVHVGSPDLAMTRASPELEAAFVLVNDPEDGDVALPSFAALEDAPEHRFAFDVWYGWMDPLAHVNHPQYVDDAEEALARILAARGIDPHGVVPIAEEMSWRSGLVAPERAEIVTRLVGVAADGIVTQHTFLGADGTRRAEGRLVRRHASRAVDELVAALR